MKFATQRRMKKLALWVTAICLVCVLVVHVTRDFFQNNEHSNVSRSSVNNGMTGHPRNVIVLGMDKELFQHSNVFNYNNLTGFSNRRKPAKYSDLKYALSDMPGVLNKDKEYGHQSNNSQGTKILPCDQECQRLKNLMASWPPDRPKAAFYYLTTSSRLSHFFESLASVDKYFNDEFKYPIIVFHESEFVNHRENVQKATRSNLFFQEIEMAAPSSVEGHIPVNIDCTSRISYRHMCRFHAKTVYEQPIMQDLQYYWRLDDDSLLLSNVSYDVFKHMENNAKQYGYMWRHLDAYSCVEGLWEATERYIDNQNLTTQFFKSWKRPFIYYNNFEISSLKMWISSEYKQYIKYIDDLGGIFYHRWGDAPIKGIAVSMFIPKKEIHHFKDVGYQHRSYIHHPYDVP